MSERQSPTQYGEDLREFMENRDRWLEVMTVPAPNGGHDIVLRLDGTYTEHADPAEVEELRAHFAERVAQALQRDGITAEWMEKRGATGGRWKRAA